MNCLKSSYETELILFFLEEAVERGLIVTETKKIEDKMQKLISSSTNAIQLENLFYEYKCEVKKNYLDLGKVLSYAEDFSFENITPDQLKSKLIRYEVEIEQYKKTIEEMKTIIPKVG